MSRKFRPAQCHRCRHESRPPNIKFPSLACEEGVSRGYSKSHANFKGQTFRSCPDFQPKPGEGK